MCLYSKIDLLCRELTLIAPPPPFIECAWTLFPRCRVVILALYVPPNLHAAQYEAINDYIITNVDSALGSIEGCSLIIAGDLNQLPTSDLMSTLNLSQRVHHPTRGNSILDKMLIEQSICEAYDEPTIIPNFGTADHSCVMIKPVMARRSCAQIKRVYDYRNSNIACFLKVLKSQPWQLFYRFNGDIDAKYDLFCKMIQPALDCIPSSFVEISQSDKPWITPVLKLLINRRYEAYRKGNFQKYNHLKIKVKHAIITAKAAWAQRLKQKPHGIWKAMKSVSPKPAHSVISLYERFPTATDAADALNNFLASLFTPETTIYPTFGNMQEKESWDVKIDVKLTSEMLRNLKPNKSAGSDELSPRLLRAAHEVLAGPLTHLFACSISACQIPLKWKQAIVVPIPKVTNPKIGDFRPISLLPIPSKMLESLVLNAVKPKLLTLYGNNQYGFRPKSSTLDAHIAIHDFVTKELDRPDTAGVAMIAMDLSKAFDRLSHESLLQTLSNPSAGLPKNFLLWLRNFLSDRTQKVFFQGAFSSDTKRVTSGVPQGSILSPYLFASHVGSLTALSQSAKVIKYADDITLLVPYGPTSDLPSIIGDEINNVSCWCKSNGLEINETKTKVLLFAKKNSSTIDQRHIPCLCSSIKILGVTFENSLKWSKHIQEVCTKASRRIYALKSLKRIPSISMSDLRLVYSNYILSVMEYNSPLFVGMNVKDNKRLERVQKRCHLIICGPECKCGEFLEVFERREARAMKVFRLMMNPDHISHPLLPRRLPRSGHLLVEPSRSSRRNKSFVPFCTRAFNKSLRRSFPSSK